MRNLPGSNLNSTQQIKPNTKILKLQLGLGAFNPGENFNVIIFFIHCHWGTMFLSYAYIEQTNKQRTNKHNTNQTNKQSA
jgi:hypothetical protein